MRECVQRRARVCAGLADQHVRARLARRPRAEGRVSQDCQPWQFQNRSFLRTKKVRARHTGAQQRAVVRLTEHRNAVRVFVFAQVRVQKAMKLCSCSGRRAAFRRWQLGNGGFRVIDTHHRSWSLEIATSSVCTATWPPTVQGGKGGGGGWEGGCDIATIVTVTRR